MAEGGGSEQVGGAQRASPSAAVFISYASPDAPIAQGLCSALEQGGVACWLAPRNVRPGDFYADSIVQAINGCAVLVLSQSSIDSPHVLREVERASAKRRPIIAFRIDAAALPPGLEYFLSTSQWIDAAAARADRLFPKLLEAVRSRISSEPAGGFVPAPTGRSAPKRKLNRRTVALAVAIAVALSYVVVDRFWLSHRATPQAVPGSAPFAPPPHSIAVLPFVNLSGDAKQDYFSDGISEEVLNSLSRLNDLLVVARTSSFSFRGQNVDVSTIAHKLNVGAILEGSVRRAGTTVRITVQLVNGVTGYRTWSKTYDRQLSDILKVQTEVATSVAQQLELKLVGDEAVRIELGGTQNPAAYDAYLRGVQLYNKAEMREADYRAALAATDQAIALDPDFAAAYALRANALLVITAYTKDLPTRAAAREQALAAAQRASALAPNLGEAHIVLARVFAHGLFDFASAAPEFDRALALAPGDAKVLRYYAFFAAELAHFAPAVTAARHAVSLDPQNLDAYLTLGAVLSFARRFDEVRTAIQDATMHYPASHLLNYWLASSLLASGQAAAAQQLCEARSTPLDQDDRQACLSLVYHALGRRADAEREFDDLKALDGDIGAYAYAGICAQWGDKLAALQWLATAGQLHDPAMGLLRVDWRLDPIRDEPQFKAIEARMKIPP